MTVSDLVFIIEAEWQQADINVTLDRPTILLHLNEALQQLYPAMLMADESLWTTSQTFTTSASVAVPANYRDTRAVVVPAAASGGARQVGHREWQTLLNNPAIAATADDPIFRLDAGFVKISPASTGTHYYLRTIPEITSYTQDLFAFNGASPAMCQWAFQEALVLGTLHLLALREPTQQQLQGESEVKRVFELAEHWKNQYDMSRRPLAIYDQNTLVPKFPVQDPRTRQDSN